MLRPQGVNSGTLKRMRIGTKSCAECRRRKVRCIFEEEQHACKECVAHDAPCVPQQPGQRGHVSIRTRYQGDVQQRLQELESMLTHICKAIDVDIESVSVAEFKTKAEEALTRRLPGSSLGSGSGESSSNGRTQHGLETPKTETPNDFEDRYDGVEDAPLLAFFKDAMFIERDNSQSATKDLYSGIDQRVNACLETLRPVLPNADDLMEMLEITQQYWFIWPVHFHDFMGSHDMFQSATGVELARKFISDSLESGSPRTTAKSILWLALCIQQLPSGFTYQKHLATSTHALVNIYQSVADKLMSLNNSTYRTFDDLECLMLQAKLYINMGKPRKSWLVIRQTMNISILLSLHLANRDKERNMWSQIWQLDRQLSLILGLPHGISESHLGLSKKLAGTQFVAQTKYALSIIGSHIIDRNQDFHNTDYSATTKIEQELEQVRAAISAEWWNTVPGPDMSLSELYTRHVIQSLYYQAVMTLHMPYMWKSSEELKFDHNKRAVLEASREMIKSYRMFRSRGGAEIIICDMMDFLVFSAAIVLVIDLLSRSSGCIYQEAEDWGLVQNVTLHLDKVARGVECFVAGQASQLLEYLSMAHEGRYLGPDSYKAVIPYFGKVRIGRLRRAEPKIYTGSETPQVFTNTVKFNMNSFMSYSQDSTAVYNLTDAELGVNWTSALEIDNNQDWSHAFEFPCHE